MSAAMVSPSDLPERMAAHRETLASHLSRALWETAFHNYSTITPRRLNEMGQEEADGFLEFLRTGDEAAARERGRNLAQAGLGHKSILALAEAIRQACLEAGNPDGEMLRALLQAVGRYTGALLEGYMAGREEHVLREQQRTYEALLRARQKQAEG